MTNKDIFDAIKILNSLRAKGSAVSGHAADKINNAILYLRKQMRAD